jgi:hypothetical protein
MSAPPLVPLTRTLPALLRRERERTRRDSTRLFVAKVTAVPDSKHVTITYGGATAIVLRLASYSGATIGDTAFCLAAGPIVIAIGRVS